jgi:hypothetical protein
VRPNPSLESTRTGMALGPPPGVVHHPSGGPSATPALAPQLKRYAWQRKACLYSGRRHEQPNANARQVPSNRQDERSGWRRPFGPIQLHLFRRPFAFEEEGNPKQPGREVQGHLARTGAAKQPERLLCSPASSGLRRAYEQSNQRSRLKSPRARLGKQNRQAREASQA